MVNKHLHDGNKASQAQAEDGSDNDTFMTPLRAKQAFDEHLPDLVGYVNHGASASTPRPTGYVAVIWLGSVEPSNAVAGDIYIEEGA